VAAGENFTLKVINSGSPPFTYQWLLNGTNLLGATNSTLALPSVNYFQRGDYSVIISNQVNSITSSITHVTVNSPPLITAQPRSLPVTAGRLISLSAGLSGSPTDLALQWRFNGTNLLGETNSTLTLTAAQVADRGFYSLVITNAFGSITSAPALLTVHPFVAGVGWAGQAGGLGADAGKACAADAAGNFYVAGAFSDRANFGTNILNSAGQNDIFIAKYNNAGVLLWIRRAGGSGFDAANGITVDPAGNAYLTGSFEGSADFGTNVLVAKDPSSFSDVFVTKLDVNGEFVWSQAFGARAVADVGNAIALDASGNVLIAASSALTNFAAAPVLGTGRILLAKLDPSGTPLWARAAGMSGIDGTLDTATGVGADVAGNIYLAGNFLGTNVTFGFGSGATNLINRGVSDGFLATYNSNGLLQRVLQIGGSEDDRVNALAVNAAGEAHLGGQFSGTLALGPAGGSVPAAVSNLTSAGEDDGFIAKFDANGGLLWGQSIGGATPDAVRGVALGPDGSVHVTGFFAGTANFGSNTLTSTANTMDVFSARYSSAGQILFVQQSGGDDPSGDYGNGIAVDPLGNSFVTGQFNGTATLGANQPISAGGSDVFAVRFNSPQSAPPQVTYRISNGHLILTWPGAAFGWGLQSALTNPVPNDWRGTSHPIIVKTNDYEVKIPLTGTKGFFRLVR